jgi:hypothetical protein
METLATINLARMEWSFSFERSGAETCAYCEGSNLYGA